MYIQWEEVGQYHWQMRGDKGDLYYYHVHNYHRIFKCTFIIYCCVSTHVYTCISCEWNHRLMIYLWLNPTLVWWIEALGTYTSKCRQNSKDHSINSGTANTHTHTQASTHWLMHAHVLYLPHCTHTPYNKNSEVALTCTCLSMCLTLPGSQFSTGFETNKLHLFTAYTALHLCLKCSNAWSCAGTCIHVHVEEKHTHRYVG